MISQEERQARRGFIGSSDAPAIARVDPWASPLAVFLEKVYEVEDLPNKGPIARGNRYESVLLDWAQDELGVEIERNVSVRHPTIAFHGANLDGRVRGRREGVEAKVTSLPDEFGEDGTDQVPERVIVQAHHQMDCADLDLVWVPVLLSRMGRPQEVMFRVDRNEDLIAAIREANREFWEAYVLPKVPPPLDGPPALDVIKRIYRVAGAVVPIDSALVQSWEEAIKERKIAERLESAAKSAVLASLGDAEIGDFGHPSKWLTYYSQHRSGYTVEPTDYRVARISKRY